MSERVTVNFRLNGAQRRVTVPPMKRLLDVLREDCGLTGTKEGCGEGECGACTVLLGGRAVNSCLVPAAHAEGAKVVTVEGLAVRGKLSTLQEAFVEHGAAQCGMCTPGMLVTAAALLETVRGRVPSDGEVREALAGTLCRCTGYQKIVDAVRDAAGAVGGSRAKGAARAAKAPAGKPAKKAPPKRPARRTKRNPAAKAQPDYRRTATKIRSGTKTRAATRVQRAAGARSAAKKRATRRGGR